MSCPTEELFNPFASYERMADVFTYPDANYAERMERVREHLERRDPEAMEEMQPFFELLGTMNAEEVERSFQLSFDIQAVTTLDISYVLFGDDYKRGQMLSYLQRDQKALGIDPGSELPDHLSNLLRTLANYQDEVLREDLIRKAVIPALDSIINDFGEERVAQKRKLYRKYHKGILEMPEDGKKLFAYPLRALRLILERDYGREEHTAMSEDSKGFVGNLDHEMAVEHTRNSSF
jgi:nitrate reductase assembly molybdenum cofactor insertion protein NarJ